MSRLLELQYLSATELSSSLCDLYSSIPLLSCFAGHSLELWDHHPSSPTCWASCYCLRFQWQPLLGPKKLLLWMDSSVTEIIWVRKCLLQFVEGLTFLLFWAVLRTFLTSAATLLSTSDCMDWEMMCLSTSAKVFSFNSFFFSFFSVSALIASSMNCIAWWKIWGRSSKTSLNLPKRATLATHLLNTGRP